MLKVSLYVGNENYCIIYGTMRNMNFNFIPNFIPTNRCLDFLYIFFYPFIVLYLYVSVQFFFINLNQCNVNVNWKIHLHQIVPLT